MSEVEGSSRSAGTRTTGERIWDALVELHRQGQHGSRERLAKITGFSMSIIDDHISRWYENGRVFRVKDGIYEPIVVSRAARMVYSGRVPGSDIVKLEVGDKCMDFTQDEAREIGRQFAGYALEYNQVTIKEDLGAAMANMMAQNQRAQAEIKEMQQKITAQNIALAKALPGTLGF